MIIIPREKPLIKNLNSYYLDIKRLVEHCQGEIGTGVVYFKAPAMECALFFDEYQIANGCCDEKQNTILGQAAIDRIMKMSSRNNFSVSVYRIRPDRIHFWANLSNSEVIYSGLTTEFTDLEGLIRKVESEKLSGYIDVELADDFKSGLLFFYKGEIIGGLSGENQGDIDRSEAYRDELITRSRESGGKFSVSRIFLEDNVSVDEAIPEAYQPGEKENRETNSKDPFSPEDTEKPEMNTERILSMLESLLYTLEQLVKSNRKIRQDFETLLNKKFVEKIDKYDFLDPFAADFRYFEGKITFTGEAGNEMLVAAITECVSEIAESLGITSQLRQKLHPWRQKFADEVIEFDLRL